MSEAKKSDGSVTLLNKGRRSFDLGIVNGKQMRHSPGETHTYTAEEAKRLSGYSKELVDISKLPGAVNVVELKAENARLLAENDALKAQLASLPSVEQTEADIKAKADADAAAKKAGKGK